MAMSPEYKAEWRIRNIERLRMMDREHYLRNRDKRIQYAETWSADNRQRVREIKAKWKKNNKDHCNVTAKRRYYSDSLKVKLRSARINNPGLPEELLAIIALKNMIREEIRNQTNQTT